MELTDEPESNITGHFWFPKKPLVKNCVPSQLFGASAQTFDGGSARRCNGFKVCSTTGFGTLCYAT